ncbi:adenosylmethionine--8-amino-7-oxononanoate transaminase [Psittacicella hinzii]|uniref:Adenosylmethionine-8-amino-7-oxononanoate aminotransferase n=1 Tax=Psittacicella hinzii TaxID=2028575 RepID=A0A3A1YEW1_9GAMM|nr:adenosylmethionine--8-amino-7-oxononanoate transaminase [Psittacicella hinzii]RIY36215.1 adenosylmethionine--8-amino-7-oxononanoate transaminase [Psittacicella hinzii]
MTDSYNKVNDAALWHPYNKIGNNSNLLITKAQGSFIYSNNLKLLDGVSSWWSVAYGHNNPRISTQIQEQVNTLSHVMFAGLTHEPAIQATNALLNITNNDFAYCFYGDSGSVAVEIALKMSLQYHLALIKPRSKFLALKNGYHGDTWHAMLVSCPENSMHSLFTNNNPNLFVAPPPALSEQAYDSQNSHYKHPLTDQEFIGSQFYKDLMQVITKHGDDIAAFICEPMVQGAGGFNFYDLRYIDKAIQILHDKGILVIFDEIATGFGRTGKNFAYQHIENKPDIITLGKALTGGHITLGATLVTEEIGKSISNNPPYAFMHGPTFMANPLALRAAKAAVELYTDNFVIDKANGTNKIADKFYSAYQALKSKITNYNCKYIANLRYLGPIFCLEFTNTVNSKLIQDFFIQNNVWLRPFGKILYLLPPYTISNQELEFLVATVDKFVEAYGSNPQVLANYQSFV